MAALLDDPILVFRFPLLVFFFSFAVLWLSAWIGSAGFKGLRAQVAESREDFSVVQGATLTLLGLIVGFTFSMALNRYDQRKNYEEEEANAIGTEYVRASLLSAADATKVRALLIAYLDQRVAFYESLDRQELVKIAAQTAKLQSELWSAV